MKVIEFTDGDRTFTCRAEASTATPGTLWWWVSVTGETSRYAAFRAEPGDTAQTLRPRILAYYAQLLADRARPPVVRQHWSQRRAAAAAPAAAAAAQANDSGAAADDPATTDES
jgi:hypothetical protein